MHIWSKRVWVSSLMRRSAVKRWLNLYIGQFFWVFAYLWTIVALLSSHLTGSRTLPNIGAHFFQDRFSTEAYGSLSSTIMGCFPLLFDPCECFCTCTVWELSLTSGVVISCSLHQMSSSPVINFVLGASRENKIQFYSSLKLPAALLKVHLPPTSITIYKKRKQSHAEWSLHSWSFEVSEVGGGQAVHWSKWTNFSYF